MIYKHEALTCTWPACSLTSPKVSCLALNRAGSLLASGQTGPLAVVRLWRFSSRQCLALFKTHHHGLHTLRWVTSAIAIIASFWYIWQSWVEMFYHRYYDCVTAFET